MKFIKKIGILGGIGPLAGANFFQTLITLAQEKYDAVQDCEFPQIFLNSAAIPGFDETGFTAPDIFLAHLVRELQILEQMGSDFIIIACNTVHHHFQDLQDALNIPILNLIEATAAKVHTDGVHVAGILSSESTNQLQLYSGALESKGVKPLIATSDQQQVLNQIILNVMGGTQSRKDSAALNEIVADMQGQGAQSVVLGCTELPLAFNRDGGPDTAHPVIYDSNEILAETALEEAYGN